MQPGRGTRLGLLIVSLLLFVSRVDQRENDSDDAGLPASVGGQHASEEEHHRERRQNRNGCRDVYRNTSGVISSPGYPSDIEDDLFCQWMIITPPEDPLSLVFYFENETAEDLCPTASEGWVVRDGMDPRGAKIRPNCQYENPRVVGVSNVVTVLFNSSTWQSSKAFRIVYSQDPFRNLTLTLPPITEGQPLTERSTERIEELFIERISNNTVTTSRIFLNTVLYHGAKASAGNPTEVDDLAITSTRSTWSTSPTTIRNMQPITVSSRNISAGGESGNTVSSENMDNTLLRMIGNASSSDEVFVNDTTELESTGQRPITPMPRSITPTSASVTSKEQFLTNITVDGNNTGTRNIPALKSNTTSASPITTRERMTNTSSTWQGTVTKDTMEPSSTVKLHMASLPTSPPATQVLPLGTPMNGTSDRTTIGYTPSGKPNSSIHSSTENIATVAPTDQSSKNTTNFVPPRQWSVPSVASDAPTATPTAFVKPSTTTASSTDVISSRVATTTASDGPKTRQEYTNETTALLPQTTQLFVTPVTADTATAPSPTTVEATKVQLSTTTESTVSSSGVISSKLVTPAASERPTARQEYTNKTALLPRTTQLLVTRLTANTATTPLSSTVEATKVQLSTTTENTVSSSDVISSEVVTPASPERPTARQEYTNKTTPLQPTTQLLVIPLTANTATTLLPHTVEATSTTKENTYTRTLSGSTNQTAQPVLSVSMSLTPLVDGISIKESSTDYQDNIDSLDDARMFMPEEVTHESNGDFVQCFFRETGTSGTISSPEYPDKVQGPNCTWVITAFPTEVIEITFPDIDIDGRMVHGTCDQAFSHLKVTTFDPNFNKQEHFYCQKTENVIHTSSENLWVDFRSHNGPAKFLSEYRLILDVVPTTDSFEVTDDSGNFDRGCSIVIHDSMGVIQTPNFPELYSKNQECFWTILALPGRSITLRFDQFDIDGPVTELGKCDSRMAHKYSFVKVSYYSEENVLTDETFCGSDSPGIISSHSNRINVYFQSGNGIGRGFEAHFTSVPRRLNFFGRTFLSQNFDPMCAFFLNDTVGSISYNDSIAGPCMWILQPSTDGSIALNIEELSFSNPFGQEQDCDVPPVTVETIDIDTLHLRALSLCENITGRIETFMSVSQINITLNTSAWMIKSFVASYRIIEEVIGIGGELVVNGTLESFTAIAPESQLDWGPSNDTSSEPIAIATSLTLATDSAVVPTDESASVGTLRPIKQTSTIQTEYSSSSAQSTLRNDTLISATCNATLSATIGRIASPRLQNDSSDLDCSWTLRASAVARLQLVFTTNFSGAVDDISCDLVSRVTISTTNDTFATGRTEETFCGPSIPRQIDISARLVTIRFATVLGDTLEVFFMWEELSPSETIANVASDTSTPLTATPPAIIGELVLPGTEQSSLPENGTVKWEELSPSGTIANIASDTSTILTTTSPAIIGEFVQPGTEQSSLPENETVNGTITESFAASTTIIGTSISGDTRPCRTHLQNTAGNISSPNYPNNYPTNLHCIWLLHLENETTVVIRFREVDFLMNRSLGNACADQATYMRIATWSDDQLELERFYFCGNMTPNDITVSGRSVVFLFVTGSEEEDTNGFHLSYFTKRTPFRSDMEGGVVGNTSAIGSSTAPASSTHHAESPPGMLSTTPPSTATDVTIPDLGVVASDTRFRLTIFICSGVALVLLCILLVLLILCVRRRNRSSALTLGPEVVAPGDYWRNYHQWARADYPLSVKPQYDPNEPSTSMHPGHQRPVPEQERLV